MVKIEILKEKKELIKNIKKQFRYMEILEFKNHREIIKMLPKFSVKDLKEIETGNDLDILNIDNPMVE